MLHRDGLDRGRGRLRAEGRDLERGHVVRLDVLQILRVLHHALQEGDARLEDLHLVPLDDRGEATRMREDGRAFGDDRRHPAQQRSCDQIALPGDPARIGDDEHDIAGRGIERHRHGRGDTGAIAAMHMHDALGLSGRTRGINDEIGIFGIDRQRLRHRPDRADEIGIGQREQSRLIGDIEPERARGVQYLPERGCSQVMAPVVALRVPHQVGLRGMAHHHHRLDARRRIDQGRRDRHAQVRRLGGIERRALRQIVERTADAAHHVRAFDRDLAAEQFGHRIGNRAAHLVIGLVRGIVQRAGEQIHRGAHADEIVERRVGIARLERHHLGVAIAAIGGDDDARARIGDAIGQGLVAEPAEHRRVDDPCALGAFGPVDLRRDGRHVERDAVARLQAQTGQRQRAFRRLQHQLLARHGIAVDRSAAPVVAGHVPAVALEDQRGFRAVPGEHVSVDLVEAAIGERALEPTPVGRVVGIEPALPRVIVGRQVETQRRARGRVPAGPCTGIAVEIAPGLEVGQIPADRRSRLVAMKAARIGDARVAHGGPAGRIGQRVGARRNGRRCHHLGGGQRTGLDRQVGWGNDMSSQLSCRPGLSRFPNRRCRMRRTKQMSPALRITQCFVKR